MHAEMVPALAEHIAPIAADARAADIEELAAQDTTPAACMAYGLAHGTRSYAALLGGVPVCMFGVVPAGPGEGVPWLVGSNGLNALRAQREFLRLSVPVVAEFERLYPLLYNTVDVRNTAAQRWLAWLGFTLGATFTQGPDVFRLFWKGALHAD